MVGITRWLGWSAQLKPVGVTKAVGVAKAGRRSQNRGRRNISRPSHGFVSRLIPHSDIILVIRIANSLQAVIKRQLRLKYITLLCQN
ncbi:MAG: hypothetical protein EZS28_053083 [Streblomastix strix]|uniref:Uncharacterized protein n=1 Tax=Streblomastix strix TaxID=222440 RepID=A0A5J4RKX6_9EUKA|nr:MAG: hypothetical protein EZS28_053083 [Streblomastix strix]